MSLDVTDIQESVLMADGAAATQNHEQNRLSVATGDVWINMARHIYVFCVHELSKHLHA